jgi:hypothetical protein
MDGLKKVELQRLINEENGTNYHKNVNLSGYVPNRGKSFIAFRLLEINNVTMVYIDYIYTISQDDFYQLLTWCINFWQGNNVKYLYYKEHRRQATVIKLLKQLGMDIKPIKYHGWKYDWTSTNGYAEEDVLEAHTV